MDTERELINNLIKHYEKIITTYEEKSQCNLTEINNIKVKSNPTTLFYHEKVFQATKRNVENITKRKKYTTANKLDKLFYDKYKRRRPRENSIPVLAPAVLANNSQQHITPIPPRDTNTQQNIPSITTANAHHLINNVPTRLSNNPTTTVANVASIPSLLDIRFPNRLSAQVVGASVASIASVVTNSSSVVSNSSNVVSNSSRVVTSRLNSTVNPTLTNLPSRVNSTSNPTLTNLPTTAITTSVPNLSNLPGTTANLPITTANLPITTANPNLTNYISSACTTITTTTANIPITSPIINPTRRICNILTPVTTNTITLNNSATDTPIRLSPIVRQATPTPTDHTYSIVTRSRARQQTDFRQ